jgi:hypothetical protein
MHSTVFDSFGSSDSIEWRHRGHFVRANCHPTDATDRFLVWDQGGELVATAPSLRAAQRAIDAIRGSQ